MQYVRNNIIYYLWKDAEDAKSLSWTKKHKDMIAVFDERLFTHVSLKGTWSCKSTRS